MKLVILFLFSLIIFSYCRSSDETPLPNFKTQKFAGTHLCSKDGFFIWWSKFEIDTTATIEVIAVNDSMITIEENQRTLAKNVLIAESGEFGKINFECKIDTVDDSEHFFCGKIANGNLEITQYQSTLTGPYFGWYYHWKTL